MNQAWYQVVSLLYGYLAAAAIVVIAFLAIRGLFSDAALQRRLRKNTPQAGAVGAFRVLSAGTRRLPAGTEIRVPYEGTMGAAHSCDVCIPHKRVHMRSAFFWMERDGLHMAALHKDGFFVDEVAVAPGDEAVLCDGAVLRVRELKLLLRLYPAAQGHMNADVGPYVTTERRNRAQQGRGEGIGAPGKGELRRERKLRQRLDAPPKARKAAAKADKALKKKNETRTRKTAQGKR